MTIMMREENVNENHKTTHKTNATHSNQQMNTINGRQIRKKATKKRDTKHKSTLKLKALKSKAKYSIFICMKCCILYVYSYSYYVYV